MAMGGGSGSGSGSGSGGGGVAPRIQSKSLFAFTQPTPAPADRGGSRADGAKRSGTARAAAGQGTRGQRRCSSGAVLPQGMAASQAKDAGGPGPMFSPGFFAAAAACCCCCCCCRRRRRRRSCFCCCFCFVVATGGGNDRKRRPRPWRTPSPPWLAGPCCLKKLMEGSTGRFPRRWLAGPKTSNEARRNWAPMLQDAPGRPRPGTMARSASAASPEPGCAVLGARSSHPMLGPWLRRHHRRAKRADAARRGAAAAAATATPPLGRGRPVVAGREGCVSVSRWPGRAPKVYSALGDLV